MPIDNVGSLRVPVADSALNERLRDVVGGKADTAIYAKDNVSSQVRYLKGLLDMMASALLQGSLEKFWEPWQDEVAGINPNWWATAVGGTGTAARDATEAGVLKVLLNCPAGADAARLRSIARWRVDPANFRANSVVRKLTLRFRAKVANLANIDNAGFVVGFTPGTGDTRATDNIAAFILVADAITSLTDNGSVETTNDLSAGLDFTAWLLFEIEVYRDGVNNTIRFTVTNAAGTQNQATHITTIPVQSMYLNFYSLAEAAVACSLHIGEVDCGYHDSVMV